MILSDTNLGCGVHSVAQVGVNGQVQCLDEETAIESYIFGVYGFGFIVDCRLPRFRIAYNDQLRTVFFTGTEYSQRT